MKQREKPRNSRYMYIYTNSSNYNVSHSSNPILSFYPHQVCLLMIVRKALGNFKLKIFCSFTFSYLNIPKHRHIIRVYDHFVEQQHTTTEGRCYKDVTKNVT